MTKFNVEEVTVCRVAAFQTKHSAKYLSIWQVNFLGIYKIFNCTAKCDFNKE